MLQSNRAGIDRSLAVACELGERDGIRRFMNATRRRFPELRIESVEIAGGLVAFAGAGGSLSEGTAVGVEHAVTARDIDDISRFFFERTETARVVVSPVSDSDLAPLLARAGYEPVEHQNTLVAAVDDLEGERHPRIVEASDDEMWAHASARGFSDDAEPSNETLMASRLLAAGGAVILAVHEGDEVIATGCYAPDDRGVGAFFAASTLPAYRRRGWQRALIRDRVARAKEDGMRYIRVSAAPLGDSERNFRALGFVPLYTRVTWERRIG